MLASAFTIPIPFGQISSIRWRVFCAAKDHVGESRAVDAKILELQSLGVPREIFQPEPVAADFERVAKVLCETARNAADNILDLGARNESGKTLFGGSSGSEEPTSEHELIHMALCFGRYWAYVSRGDTKAAERALRFALRHFHAAHWHRPAWRGANLGGWLLLEPGPASPFYEVCKETLRKMSGADAVDKRSGKEAAWLEDESEHCLCKTLEQVGGPSLRKQLFAKHRATHYTKETFEQIRKIGLNAVRIPFGYWVVTGPAKGEAFEGPCLEVLDSAVSTAASKGLQVLLDLHGCPGGESGERPCGRTDHNWDWTHWRTEEAVSVLTQVARRYKDSECVTGLQVCNEPSMRIPTEKLCEYYEAAIQAIRCVGMGADRVAVVLPVYNQHRLPAILSYWQEHGNFFKYDNVVFDLHYYHQFDPVWNLLSQEQHIEVVQDHALELATLPGAMVGEWSLSRPSEFAPEDVRNFAIQQVLAYNHSTHGWFFWNWHDYEFYKDWDMERGVFGLGHLPTPLGDHLTHDVLFPDWKDDSWSTVPDKIADHSWLPWFMSFLPSMQNFAQRLCIARLPG